MSRRFLAGAGCGSIVAVLGLAVVSQIAPPPRMDIPLDSGAMPSAGSGTQMAQPADAAGLQAGQAAQAPANAPSASAGTVPDAATVPAADPAAGTQGAGMGAETTPETGVAAGSLPAVPQDQPGALVGAGQAGAAGSGADAQMPAIGAAPTATQVPEQPQPDLAGAAPVAPDLSVPTPEVLTDMEAAPAAPALGSKRVQAPSSGDRPDIVTRAGNGLPDSSLADLPPGEPDLPPMPQPSGPVNVFVPTAPVAVPPKPPAAEPEVVAQTPGTAAVRPPPGAADQVDGVTTGRLPSIGAQPEVAADAGAVAPATSDKADLPPIARYASAFENPDKKPIFAILLQDTGGPDLDREALAALPFPVSFIIDPAAPDAARAASVYRAAGHEVLMLATGIPEGATPADLEVSFAANARNLPEAVAIVDPESGGFQANRTLATQVLRVVADQGRGVISWDRGLNPASQIARREGIRSAVIFRALDTENESSATIRRYLDRAAFKAAQDGRVVVAGQTRPETVAALLEWAVEGRAATVVLAPATAAMMAQ